MQQLTLTYTLVHEDADPVVDMQTTGFDEKLSYEKVFALKKAYEEVKARYEQDLRDTGMLNHNIYRLMAAL